MIKSILAMIVITASCALMACSPSRSRPESELDLALMQSRLAASEEKVEQLSREVARLELMVDSQQQALGSLDAPPEVAAGQTDGKPPATLSDAPPSPATPPTEPVPAMEEAPVSEDSAPVGLENRQAASPQPPRDLQKEAAPEVDTGPVVNETNPRYQQAMEIFRKEDYETAAPLFEAFAAEFPEDDLADNALYWAGECKYTRKKFTEAIERFKRVVTEYPSGSKVPDALLKIGFAYISLGDSDSALPYLKQVVAQYPFSSAGAKAEERLKALR